MSQMLPFVLFGIGIDDSFILVGAYYDTNPASSLRERLTIVAHTAAPSITATSLTDIVAFAFGAATMIPIVRWFCFYAAVCVLIDYLYQITFFVALMVIDHHRKKAARYDLFCCFKAAFPAKSQAEETESANCPNTRDNPNSGNWVDSYTTFLLKPTTKICVIFLFTALFVGGAVLASKVTVDIKEEELTPYDSQIDRFTEAFRDNFVQEKSGLFQAHIYYQELDVSDPIVRQQMLRFRHELLNLSSDAYPPYPSFLEDFEAFSNRITR
jgi:predicted RND superfamily exporter protein